MYVLSGEPTVIMIQMVGKDLQSSKQHRKFDEEIFHSRNLSELEVMKAYQIKISKRFAALKNEMMATTKIGLGKTLKSISKPQPNRVSVCMN